MSNAGPTAPPTSGRVAAARSRPRYALYLAVLPIYRQACIAELLRLSSGTVAFFAGDHHLDRSVRTGVDPQLYRRVRNVAIGGSLLLQLGHWMPALSAETTVVDLNPRSLTAWLILLTRRLLGRRTLVWGHLHPRKGPASRTAPLRRAMRRLARGTVLYDFASVAAARRELPGQPVWVAPNALYARADLVVDAEADRTDVLYVGRLVADKKVDTLITAWSQTSLRPSGGRLRIVGDGADRIRLQRLADDLGITDSVQFLGGLHEVAELRRLYQRAICATSPGYAGLSLTQSLGFGVPVVVSRDEPHAPEIELGAHPGAVHFFATDSAAAMASVIDQVAAAAGTFDRERLNGFVRSRYSAERMAEGLWAAFTDTRRTGVEPAWS